MEAGRTSAAWRFPTAVFHALASFRALFRRFQVKRVSRSLRICESLSIGERRLLMVIQFERKRFLIGATNQSISLLDRLDDRNQGTSPFDDSPWVNSLWKGPH